MDNLKVLNFQTIDGWEQILGQTPNAQAWGASYWNAVVLKRAAMARSIPRVIVTPGGDELLEEDVDIDWQDGLGGMIYRASASLDRYGAAYCLIFPTRGGGVHKVRWANPGSIRLDFDEARGKLRGFHRELGEERGEYFAYDEDSQLAQAASGLRLGFVWSLGLNEVGPGFCLEDMVKLPAGLLQQSDAVMKVLFDRGAVAQHVVFSPTEPPESERGRIISSIRRALFGGTEKSNDVTVLSNALRIEKVGTDPNDLALTDVDASNMADVSAVADLPRMLLDPDTGANRALLDRVSSNFILNTILPHTEHIIQAYNRQIMQYTGELTIKLAPQSMTINQEDEKLRANAFALYVSQGVPHETAAAILGIDVPEGMELVTEQPDPVEPTPMTEDVQPSQEVDDDGEAKTIEAGQFRRWYRNGRIGKDVTQFKANHLSEVEKLAIAAKITREAWGVY